MYLYCIMILYIFVYYDFKGCGQQLHSPFPYIIWALMQENLSLGFANSKDADQPAHSPCLNSAFVIC